MKKLFEFWRSTLTRKIFGWFGLTILVTLTIVTIIVSVVHATGLSQWQKEVRRFERFTGNQIAILWDRTNERDALIQAIARDLEVHARIEASDGHIIIAHGQECDCERYGHNVEIVRDGQFLGRLIVCKNRTNTKGLVGLLLTLMLVFGILWLSSFIIARDIGRPLGELSQVAKALGDGDLSARSMRTQRETAEIITLATALNDMGDRIEQQLKSQRRLLAEVSHELRTPLGHLRLLIEIIREGGATTHSLDDLEQEIVEMDDLVDQLLATSRLDFDVHNAHPLDATTAALNAIERAGVDPTLLEVLHQGTFSGDSTLIGRALANLIRNARQHGGGVTAFRVERRGRDLAFIVEDKGPGLPDDERRSLFDPFYQLDAPTQNGSLGLGLFLVRKIAAAHGGDVIAEENEGGGARVGLLVPLV